MGRKVDWSAFSRQVGQSLAAADGEKMGILELQKIMKQASNAVQKAVKDHSDSKIPSPQLEMKNSTDLWVWL